jgi:hypothetical protein
MILNFFSYVGVFLTLYWLTLVILLKKCGIQRDLFIPVATLLLCIATAVSAITYSFEKNSSTKVIISISSLI